jgi:transcriptional regulator with XRE-family HTH domain/sRNA-binding regulator protein Hfq
VNEINFGRRLKELKRARSVVYSEISEATKIRRDRLIALEENEVVPTDAERQALAEYYGVPPQELGASSAPVRPQARPQNIEQRAPRPSSYQPEPGNREMGFRRPSPQRNGFSQRPVSGPGGMTQQGGRGDFDRPRSGLSQSKRSAQQSRSGHEALGDMEAGFLRKQQDTKTPMVFHFINGKTFTGLVTGFTPYVIIIKDDETGEERVLRKLAIAYYEKKDLEQAESQPEAQAESLNGNSGEQPTPVAESQGEGVAPHDE